MYNNVFSFPPAPSNNESTTYAPASNMQWDDAGPALQSRQPQLVLASVNQSGHAAPSTAVGLLGLAQLAAHIQREVENHPTLLPLCKGGILKYTLHGFSHPSRIFVMFVIQGIYSSNVDAARTAYKFNHRHSVTYLNSGSLTVNARSYQTCTHVYLLLYCLSIKYLSIVYS